MAKLSKEEADQLAALRAKEEAPDEEPDDDDAGPGDGEVIMLRGKHADSFLATLLGPAKPAKKAAPAKATAGAGAGAGEGETGEGETGEGEPPPKPANRYFR